MKKNMLRIDTKNKRMYGTAKVGDVQKFGLIDASRITRK